LEKKVDLFPYNITGQTTWQNTTFLSDAACLGHVRWE